ncbi:MAG TPA: DegT/DnrJ/EryC1/StrS family aminotransferase, partial [Nitrospirota bacterium]|nr:DegT/DnrJ/EryC1/StrS family aminotransferase [Nitrospirota bacterium]
GATPMFVDIDERTMNMDPEALERALADMDADTLRRVRAVVPVHMAGHPCEMDYILYVAGRYGIKVVEDAAHALPATYRGRMVGTIGDATAFSFYATKCITTGEGGMVVTDNDLLAERVRVMSLHGISRDAWKRYTSEGSWYYEINYPGYKYNMPDIQGAIGLQQLRKADALLGIRERHAAAYTDAFRGMPGLETPRVSEDVRHSWHLYIVRLKLRELRIDRARFIEELKARGVLASVHFIPLHMHPYYREKYGYEAEDFPVAASVYERIVSLPFYPRMTDEELQYVIDCVRDIVARNTVRRGFSTRAADAAGRAAA